MTQAKRIYILIIKVNKIFLFSSLQCFLKEIENMSSVLMMMMMMMMINQTPFGEDAETINLQDFLPKN